VEISLEKFNHQPGMEIFILPVCEQEIWVLEKRRIQSNYSLFYEHYQTILKRYIQTAMKAVLIIIHSQSFLKANLWNYAFLYVVDYHNAIPHTLITRPLISLS